MEMRVSLFVATRATPRYIHFRPLKGDRCMIKYRREKKKRDKDIEGVVVNTDFLSQVQGYCQLL